MKRKELASIITDFCIEYKIFNTSCTSNELKKRIEEQLDDDAFIESLINMIIVRAKNNENIDTNRLIEILLELEKIRLELEYRVRGLKC